MVVIGDKRREGQDLSAAPDRLERVRVLVVGPAAGTSKALREAGFDVEEVPTAAAALVSDRDRRFDLAQ